MGHVFQAKCWERNPMRCSFGCLWLRKLEMAKALENHEAFIGILFMNIKEIRGKER